MKKIILFFISMSTIIGAITVLEKNPFYKTKSPLKTESLPEVRQANSQLGVDRMQAKGPQAYLGQYYAPEYRTLR